MNVPVPGLMDKLSRIKNSPITHDVLFESAVDLAQTGVVIGAVIPLK